MFARPPVARRPPPLTFSINSNGTFKISDVPAGTTEIVIKIDVQPKEATE